MENTLKTGDRIYTINSASEVIKTHVVMRVTKTTAVCDSGLRLNIKYTGQYLSLAGRYAYNPYSYSIETPEVKNSFTRTVRIARIKKFPFDTLDDEGIKAVIDVLVKHYKPKENEITK